MPKNIVLRRLHFIIFIFFCSVSSSSFSSSWQYGISMYGDLKYPVDFTNFEYVNSKAPKGGSFKQATIGSFDSLNPYIVKGRAASGIASIYDTLLKQAADEPFSLYGLIAQQVRVAEDYSSVSFKINPSARFHDGEPITASDVKFSFELLISEGAPHYRSYYSGVDHVTADNPQQVSFYFNEKNNRELPLIIGQLPILPEHFWKDKNFSKADLTIPLGSGPYRVASYKAGKQIIYQRVNDYWAKDLAVNKGMHNFDKLVYEYYRDDSVAFEAFKSGAFDYRMETSSKRWATSYKSSRFSSGDIRFEKLADNNPQGMQGFWFNLRKDKFKDVHVRQAVGLLFDFEWANKNLFYGAYSRINSFFSGSPLAAAGKAQGKELALLEPYKDQLPDSVFQPLVIPERATDGNNRAQMRQAVALFEKAGYTLKDSKMQDKNGRQFTFEFLLYSKDFERVVQPFRRNLQRIGIKTTIRLVDISQFVTRLNDFDFDIVSLRKGQSSSPGNEQSGYWGCDSVMQPGTANWAGICSPVIDKLIDTLIMADTREQLVDVTRALDRVLLSQYIVIPHWYLSAYRIAYWNKFSRPKIQPYYQLGLETWWLTGAETDAQEEL